MALSGTIRDENESTTRPNEVSQGVNRWAGERVNDNLVCHTIETILKVNINERACLVGRSHDCGAIVEQAQSVNDPRHGREIIIFSIQRYLANCSHFDGTNL